MPTSTSPAASLAAEFDEVLTSRGLTAVFQPLIHLDSCEGPS